MYRNEQYLTKDSHSYTLSLIKDLLVDGIEESTKLLNLLV